MAVNLFGIIGYCIISLQFLIVLMAYFDPLQTLLYSATPPKPEPVIQQPATDAISEPSTFSVILGLALVVVMMGVTIYVFLKAPAAIARAGSKVVHRATEKAAPVVLHAQHKKNTKPNRKKISVKLSMVIKSLLITLPLIAVVVSPLFVKPYLDVKIAVIASVALAIISLLCFVFQYSLAFIMKLDRKHLW